jgi:outer membrane protein OmpA-like peptidoglycan-associated protein/ABC-type nitrate/sulfonate/bicarbonate transport system substrate-binding protein
MSNGAGKPKPAFFIAIAVIVLGLIGFAFYRFTAKKKDDVAGGGGSQFVDPRKAAGGDPKTAENPDPNAPPTTETKYEYEPLQRLPEVKGVGQFKALGTPRTVRFAVNVWAGWAPIIWANQGHAPKKKWKDAKGGEFQVELVLIDDPVTMRDTVASGNVHIGWATVDMLPLMVQGLKKDSRTMPRVYQQIDWSNGGDGIVVREAIKDVGSLRGKTVVLAQNSPSHYFLMNMLLNAGVSLKDVKLQPVKTAFQAAAAFNQNKNIAAAVSWAPDIYNLTKPGTGNKMLVSTVEANKLIADVWFARADFGQAHPEIIEGLVRGIFDAMEELQTDQNKEAVGKLMDKFYNLPPGTAKGMLGDAHWTNHAENRDFFLVSSNPTNFERTYDTAYLLYNESKMIDEKVPFDKLVDFSIVKKLAGEPKYAAQKNTYEFKFTPASAESLNVESKILDKTVVIKFFPNSNDLFHKVPGPSGGVVLYDGNVEFTIEQIAKLAGTFGAARIVIEGHTDGSMKGVADEALVKELSQRRANSVKEALVNKFKMNPNQFSAAGYGWSKPADPADPNNHAKNRRVEVKVVPAEAQ